MQDFFLGYSLSMNFSLNIPLHEFYVYFVRPPPPITFLMVRPLHLYFSKMAVPCFALLVLFQLP